MLAPGARRDEAVIGCTADALRPPFVERALIRRSPTAVVLEPLVCVGDRLGDRARRGTRAHAPSAGCQHSDATDRGVDLHERPIWDRCHGTGGSDESR